MPSSPPARSIRRIVGPSRANRGARTVMIIGGVLQAGAILGAAAALIDMRTAAVSPGSAAILMLATIAYLPATYLTALGYAHLDPARAILFFLPAAVVGVLATVLMVVTGEAFGPGLANRLEGEPDSPAPPLNFASQLVTSSEATRVLGRPANPPTEARGFGSSVSICQLRTVDGRASMRLELIQGPRVVQLFERYQRRGDAVADVGDAAVLNRRMLTALVADTLIKLSVIGVKLDDERRAALLATGKAVVERLRQPVPAGPV